jgi:hypothetical protein
MTMKNFDDIFSRKVKEAFDNYNADHLAEEGWNAYVSKHGGSRKRTILIPLWARAASIIVLVTAGVLFINRLSHREAGSPADQVALETGNQQADSLKNKDDSTSSTGSSGTERLITAATPEITASKPLITAAAPGSPAAKSLVTAAVPGKTVATSEIEEPTAFKTIVKADITETDTFNTAVTAGVNSARQNATTIPAIDNPGNSDEITARLNIPDGPFEINLTESVDARLNLKPKKPLKDYLVLPREKKTMTIMTGFSGMMARVDNATSTSQGISIGFYVEQQLSRRISVRPGLAMASHNYAMESTPGGNIALDYAAPELNGMPAATTSYDADINIVSMEVPVNFVFSLWKRQQSNLFVTTGASTVIYLSQHLSGSFNNTYTRTTVDSNSGSVSYETMTTTVQVESEQEFLNRVDLLGLANFSAGYSLPFGKTTHLLFEPFVQLPLKDLTSLNLRIRYGGLSMKIRF